MARGTSTRSSAHGPARFGPTSLWVRKAVERIEPDTHRVVLKDGETLGFDLLVIASGARLRPAETPGLAEALAERSVHDFYTLEGAQALRAALERFEGGRFVVNVVEMPIKCPVAAMELLFLADAYFVGRGIRERVELVYVTPLDGAFTRPMCNKVLRYLIERKGIGSRPSSRPARWTPRAAASSPSTSAR